MLNFKTGAFMFIIAFLLYLLINIPAKPPKPEIKIEDSFDSLKIDSTALVEEKIVEKFLYGYEISSCSVVEGRVKKNQVFVDLLTTNNVNNRTVQLLCQIDPKKFNINKITTDNPYYLIFQNDTLRHFVYEKDKINFVKIDLTDTALIVTSDAHVVQIVEKYASGEISLSLYETLQDSKISPELTNMFVDIFAWQIDFNHLQKGDHFKLFYEEKFANGKSIGIDKISVIEFVHFNKTRYAFPFDQGHGIEYFDNDNQSLRKALLKYPIEFTRISSKYNLKRFHPVQKRYKPHLGTDFAAPVGTPIRSVGDGRVVEAQYKSANGNYVKIQHNSVYTTQYLHMSKIAKGIHANAFVNQGQIIGYVGQTGLANGPHLCYRFWKNGKQVDALRVELPAADPIKKDSVWKFESYKLKMLQKLDSASR